MDYVLFIYFCVIFSNDVGAAPLLIAALLSVWLCYSVLVGGGCSCDADNDDVFNYGVGNMFLDTARHGRHTAARSKRLSRGGW